MRSRGEGGRDLQLILEIFPDFLAIDPEFHAFGNAIESVAGAPEGKGLSYGVSAAGSADADAELVGRGRIAVGGGIGVDQDFGASFAKSIPSQSDVVTRVIVQVANKREESVDSRIVVWRVLQRLEGAVSVAQHVGGKGAGILVAAGNKDIEEEISVEIAGSDVIGTAGRKIADEILILDQQLAIGILKGVDVHVA